jgi:CRISPR-associated endonuclease/helicase Cas3
VGKYSDDFQVMIKASVSGKPHRKVAHSPYGACLAKMAKRYDIALAVLGHHSGLSDAGDLRTAPSADVERKAERLLAERAIRMDGLAELATACQAMNPRDLAEPTRKDLWIRMLFSCLVDADRLDCYRLQNGAVPNAKLLQPQPALERLLAYVNTRSTRPMPIAVAEARRRVLESCLAAAGKEGSLFSLPVPTGGGKTLGSLAFALKRAILRPNEVRRIIVVIPYLSIIEQNASIIRDIVGTENVLEHHSGSFERLEVNRAGDGAAFFVPAGDINAEEPTADRVAHDLLTENWDAPVVVTTSVRFFESLYSNRPGDLRRIHNIARSVVIVDEVRAVFEIVSPKGERITLHG